jgi:hypothetical protein
VPVSDDPHVSLTTSAVRHGADLARRYRYGDRIRERRPVIVPASVL